VVALLAVNVALTPADPAMENWGFGAAYRVSWDPPADASSVVRLAGLVPADATVLATNDLFPLVANDPHAYSLYSITDPSLALPFTPDNPPPYVLLSEDHISTVPSWLAGEIYYPPAYGVRGVDWSSPAGTVLLFESGYAEPPTMFGPPPPLGGIFHGATLATSSAGFPATVNGSTYSTVVESDPGETGNVWFGPGISLPSGDYVVTLSLRVLPLPGFPPPNASTPVLWVAAVASAQPTFYGWAYTMGDLESPSFRNVSFTVALPAPTVGFAVQGELDSASVQVTLNYLEIGPG
jgi:hypothetical protein